MNEFADIAETYDWTEQSTVDIPFFVDLARQAESPILELGAGTGRITIPIAGLSVRQRFLMAILHNSRNATGR